MSEFVITGHRGAMAVEPENTLRSFAAAVEMGVDEIELDVHLSRDGRLVVMHDETVDRTTDGSGAVRDLVWAELQELDAGEGERIPVLEDVLDTFPDMAFQVEVKAGAATRAVLDVIGRRQERRGRIVITSFLVEPLEEALVDGRTWRVGLICGRDEVDKVATANVIGVDQVYLHWGVSDTREARRFAALGRPVFVWPANDEPLVRRAIAEGYAGTTCDDPRIALAVRSESAAEPAS